MRSHRPHMTRPVTTPPTDRGSQVITVIGMANAVGMVGYALAIIVNRFVEGARLERELEKVRSPMDPMITYHPHDLRMIRKGLA